MISCEEEKAGLCTAHQINDLRLIVLFVDFRQLTVHLKLNNVLSIKNALFYFIFVSFDSILLIDVRGFMQKLQLFFAMVATHAT